MRFTSMRCYRWPQCCSMATGYVSFSCCCANGAIKWACERDRIKMGVNLLQYTYRVCVRSVWMEQVCLTTCTRFIFKRNRHKKKMHEKQKLYESFSFQHTERKRRKKKPSVFMILKHIESESVIQAKRLTCNKTMSIWLSYLSHFLKSNEWKRGDELYCQCHLGAFHLLQ